MNSWARIIAFALPIVENALQLLETAKSEDPERFNKVVRPQYKSFSDRYAALMDGVTEEDLGEIGDE